MSLLRRLKGGLDALLAPAADPRQTFAGTYERQRTLLAQVQQALTAIGSSKTQLEHKIDEVRQKLPQLEEQARRALLGNREDLARLALQRRQVALAELQTLEQQLREVQDEEQRLTVVEQRLSTQIEAFFARQQISAVRYSAAEAQVRIHEALAGVSEDLAGLGEALQETEQKTEAMQARASAIDRLVEAGVLELPGTGSGDDVARQIAALDAGASVEAQLAALKRQLDLPAGAR